MTPILSTLVMSEDSIKNYIVYKGGVLSFQKSTFYNMKTICITAPASKA